MFEYLTKNLVTLITGLFLPDVEAGEERLLRRQPRQCDLIVVDLGDGQVPWWVRVDCREGDVRLTKETVAQGIELKRPLSFDNKKVLQSPK